LPAISAERTLIVSTLVAAAPATAGGAWVCTWAIASPQPMNSMQAPARIVHFSCCM
jgi:hypothetical protein